MLKSAIIIFVCLSFFVPSAFAEEEFEFTHCFAGKVTLVHEYEEIPSIGTYYIDGIIMSNSDNKFLHNAVTHCTGVWKGKTATSYCLAIDTDGDMITWGGPRMGKTFERKFEHGTGKYKGMTGSHVSNRIVYTKRQYKPENINGCTSLKGKIELSSN